MKVTKRDVGLLLFLLGIVSAFCVYRFVYSSINEKIDNVKAETATIQVTQEQLAELEANMPFYESEIVRLNAEASDIEAHFPSAILPENEIMYAVSMEDANEVYFGTLSYGTPNAITTGYEESTGITAYCLDMSMSYQSTYQGLKDVILYNKDQFDRMVIDNVSATFDASTGNLFGSMNLKQYYMTGVDRIYEEPFVPVIPLGRDNIFGTLDVIVEEDTAAETSIEEIATPAGGE